MSRNKRKSKYNQWFVCQSKDGELVAIEDNFTGMHETIAGMKVLGSVAAKEPNDAISWVEEVMN